jgi:hypothetical protein
LSRCCPNPCTCRSQQQHRETNDHRRHRHHHTLLLLYKGNGTNYKAEKLSLTVTISHGVTLCRYVLAQNKMLIGLRVSIDSTAVMLRCIVTYITISYLESGTVALCFFLSALCSLLSASFCLPSAPRYLLSDTCCLLLQCFVIHHNLIYRARSVHTHAHQLFRVLGSTRASMCPSFACLGLKSHSLTCIRTQG